MGRRNYTADADKFHGIFNWWARDDTCRWRFISTRLSHLVRSFLIQQSSVESHFRNLHICHSYRPSTIKTYTCFGVSPTGQLYVVPLIDENGGVIVVTAILMAGGLPPCKFQEKKKKKSPAVTRLIKRIGWGRFAGILWSGTTPSAGRHVGMVPPSRVAVARYFGRRAPCVPGPHPGVELFELSTVWPWTGPGGACGPAGRVRSDGHVSNPRTMSTRPRRTVQAPLTDATTSAVLAGATERANRVAAAGGGHAI